MDRKEREEELYLEYQSKLRAVEENMENWQRRWKTFEQEREDSRVQMREDRALTEGIVELWGNSPDSSRILCMIEESITEENAELQKEEQRLLEEKKKLMAEQSHLEETYDKERRKVQGE